MSRDADAIVGEVKDDEAAGTVREEGNALRGEEELILVDDNVVYRVGRDDGVVVGEFPFEQASRERTAGSREAGIAFVKAQCNFSGFLGKDTTSQELGDTSR